MSTHQLILTSWLDDINGSAKLTIRQQKLIAEVLETRTVKLENESTDRSEANGSQVNNELSKLLKPPWNPNEILNVFYEEREKIIQRDQNCKGLASDVDSVLNDIMALKNLYLFVSPRTSQLHSECKNIIQERNDLKESYERISNTLSKQEELRSIFRRMPDIKNHILQVLNQVLRNYQDEQQKQSEVSSGTPLEEYYGKFFIECRRMKELTSQLESCLSTSNTQELLLHLEEIYTLYFDVREQLIEPVFTRHLNNLITKADRNFCDLFRQTCYILIRTLRNELQLFYQIFPVLSGSQPSTPASKSPDDSSCIHGTSNLTKSVQHRCDLPIKRQAINDFLGLLCKIFYEHLRPVVIHVNHLETLTELYKLLMETMKSEVSEDCYQQTVLALAEDIQERMVFRAEVFIQESVLEYKPSRGDLAYPEKLEIVTGGELRDFQSMWYPTVQRTVLALFYLNRVFDSVTFKELAQEVVLACFKSLDIAQRLIDERHGGTRIEASLFLSKHLAIIRDQLLAYGIEKVQFPISQQAKAADTTESIGDVFELNTSDLESMLRLFQQEEGLHNATSNEHLWSKLNETIVSGTNWTLRATRIRR